MLPNVGQVKQGEKRDVGNDLRFLDDDRVHKLDSKFFKGVFPIGRQLLGQRRGKIRPPEEVY